MGKSLIACAIVILTSAIPVRGAEPALPLPPLPPDTATEIAPEVDLASAASVVEDTLHPEQRHPARVVVPSVRIDSPVIPVGVNAKGEMDVPDGSTNNVGWYAYGTIPGDIGSAVLDAHVYAAFRPLKKLKKGAHIYVVNQKGETLDYVVTDMRTYALKDVPSDTLFNRADTERLNLITCAGTFRYSLGTYDKRLIVYAELAK